MSKTVLLAGRAGYIWVNKYVDHAKLPGFTVLA
jgi:hypothetical protein